MKIKIVLIALVTLCLVGCGKTEEEKNKEAVKEAMDKARAEEMAKDIIQYQKSAIKEALTLIAGQKIFFGEIFSNNRVCLSSDDNEEIKKVIQPIADNSKYIKTFDFKNDCTINVTFKDSALAPDLKGETLTLKMIPEKDMFTWKCSFTGKNKNDLPSACK